MSKLALLMRKLKRLTQDESGRLYGPDGKPLNPECTLPRGKIRTLVVPNNSDISQFVDEMVERYPASVPHDADYYIVSEFNGETQHMRIAPYEGRAGLYTESLHSVYALQFYWALL